ncbi:MAG TPA: hypothetical protein VK395_22340 [Gemmataceae bacterium]|nr:hypothetical protein [Gemmataceae bacterium]
MTDMDDYCPICGEHLGRDVEHRPYLWARHWCDPVRLAARDRVHRAAAIEPGRFEGHTFAERLADGFALTQLR